LILEEKLFELMLEYGDQVLQRTTESGDSYVITVIEEVMDHVSEDGYERQSEINRKIVQENEEGVSEKELTSGKYYFGLMDEELTGHVAVALFEQYENSDWSKHNIYFSQEEEVVPKL